MTAILSVIIPVLNDTAALERLLAQLQPVRDQTQIIVVDGGSKDGDVAALCQGRADVFLPSRPGRALQMNTGARAASAPLLWFVHADTQLPADAVQHIAAALKNKSWGRFDVRIEGQSRFLPVIAWAMNGRSRWSGIATGDQGLFFRTETFHALNGYADLPLMEDIDICTRALAFSQPACLRSKLVTSGRRWDKHGVVRTVLLMWWLRWRFWLGTDARVLHSIYYPSSASQKNS